MGLCPNYYRFSCIATCTCFDSWYSYLQRCSCPVTNVEVMHALRVHSLSCQIASLWPCGLVHAPYGPQKLMMSVASRKSRAWNPNNTGMHLGVVKKYAATCTYHMCHSMCLNILSAHIFSSLFLLIIPLRTDSLIIPTHIGKLILSASEQNTFSC